MGIEDGGVVEFSLIGEGGEFGIGHGGPEEIGESGGELEVVEGEYGLIRLDTWDGGDEKELWGDQDGFEHEPQGFGIGELVLIGEVEDFEQHIQLDLRCGTAIGTASEGAGDVSGGGAGVGVWGWGVTEELVLQVGGGFATGGEDAIENFVGDPQVLLHLKRGDGVQVAFAEDLVGQFVGDLWIDAEEIVEGIAILHLGEATHDEGAGIFVAEILDGGDGIDEVIALLVGGLIVRIVGRHVVSHDVGEGFFPLAEVGAGAGVFQCRVEIESALHASLSVAFQAVFGDERSDLGFENLLCVVLLRRNCGGCAWGWF